MGAVGYPVAKVIAAMISPFRRPVEIVQQQVYNTDEESAERGLPLEVMNSSGMRQRSSPGQAQESPDESEGSPTATTEGTLTPNSTEDTSQPPGKQRLVMGRRDEVEYSSDLQVLSR